MLPAPGGWGHRFRSIGAEKRQGSKDERQTLIFGRIKLRMQIETQVRYTWVSRTGDYTICASIYRREAEHFSPIATFDISHLFYK